ncbi:unnamed protein product [Nezara viridula]|uniref:Chloride channel CLIC-like protein 1 n=1 Tax=Nezara viridula TaxID=85310 RepID=A0A9P0MHI6_NEZVI|nr:unnamed protein product [Nezara viridula]
MNFVIYSVLALFWLTYFSTVGDSDFFESSPQSENDWDSSRDFFGEYTVEENDPPLYRTDDFQSGRKDRSSRHYNNKEDLRYKAYLSRFINIFLSNAGFWDDVFEDGSKSLRVDLTLSKENFDILKHFGSDEEISLETLENSFRSMFNSKHNFYIETSVVMEYLKYAILIALLLAIVTFTVFVLRKISFKIPGISFILFISYIAVVFQGLLKQYEDISENIILKRMEFDNLGTPPKECFYSKMTFLEKMYVHIFKDDPCQRFLQSRKSVWYEMDLVSAFIKPFQSFFSTLCSILGEGSEQMIKPFVDRSPWPINILLEFLVTIMQLPLLFFGIFLIFIAFTPRSIYLKIPFLLSMATEKKDELNYNLSRKKSREESESRCSEGCIKNYVINKGGIVLLGNEDKQFPSLSIQDSSLNINSQPHSFKTSHPTNDPLMNREAGYSEDIKSGSIINKQLAINKKKVKREHKKLTYVKKMNFKPSKRDLALKVAKESLDTFQYPEH